MMCQMIGLPPTSIMGLGFKFDSSLMRVPRPPARITAFIGSDHPIRKVSRMYTATSEWVPAAAARPSILCPVWVFPARRVQIIPKGPELLFHGVCRAIAQPSPLEGRQKTQAGPGLVLHPALGEVVLLFSEINARQTAKPGVSSEARVREYGKMGDLYQSQVLQQAGRVVLGVDNVLERSQLRHDLFSQAKQDEFQFGASLHSAEEFFPGRKVGVPCGRLGVEPDLRRDGHRRRYVPAHEVPCPFQMHRRAGKLWQGTVGIEIMVERGMRVREGQTALRDSTVVHVARPGMEVTVLWPAHISAVMRPKKGLERHIGVEMQLCADRRQ